MMLAWVNMYLDGLSDKDLKQSLVDGGNHGVWLLGHLIASEDDLTLYLGQGELLFPHYQELFSQGSPCRPVDQYPPTAELRKHWQQVTARNDTICSNLTDAALAQPHAQLQGPLEEDYFKTKARCLMAWTLHQVHHAGQLAALRAQCGKPRLV